MHNTGQSYNNYALKIENYSCIGSELRYNKIMNTYKFTIPNRDTNIFRCDVYGKGGNFLYHREVHMYDKNLSDELNTTLLTKKMADTLNVKEHDLYIPVRMAVLLGESTWQNSVY